MSVLVAGLVGRVQPQAGHPAGVAFNDFEPPAGGMLQHLAGPRYSAGEHEGEAAERIDILLDQAEPFVDRLGDVLELGAGVGLPQAGPDLGEQAGSSSSCSSSMSPTILSTNPRGEQLGAAELVDDDGEMDPPRAHHGPADRACPDSGT